MAVMKRPGICVGGVAAFVVLTMGIAGCAPARDCGVLVDLERATADATTAANPAQLAPHLDRIEGMVDGIREAGWDDVADATTEFVVAVRAVDVPAMEAAQPKLVIALSESRCAY